MNRVLAAETLESPSRVDDLFDVGVGRVCVTQTTAPVVPVAGVEVVAGSRRVQTLIERRLLAEDGRRRSISV